VGAPAAAQDARPALELFTPEVCLSCLDYALHLSENGFEVTVTKSADMTALKRRLGVPRDFESVPTAAVAGYFIEGHVPARDIKSLLEQRPQARGLAVPGLPMGAPGYEAGDPTCERGCVMLDPDSGSRNPRREVFDTLLIGPDGTSRVWARN
jgi:hypothetical protein